jgi:Rrf2 family protein
MLKISKKSEYALLAIKYIALEARKNGLSAGYINEENCNCVNAKEISVNYNIPYDLLCKILQRLARKKIITSFQGVKGGYTLARSADDITINDVISSIEKVELTNCLKADGHGSSTDCARFDCCQIKDPLSKIQTEINKLFNSTTINQIL